MDVQQRYSSGYINGKFPIQSDLQEKTEKEFLARCQHWFGMYCYGDAAIGFAGRTRAGVNFRELRDYAAGLMPVTKYQDMIDKAIQDKKSKRLFRRLNISWRVNPTLPKHIDRIKTRFKEVSMTPTVTATDEAAAMAKEFLVSKMKMVADPRTKAFAEAIGQPVPGMESVGSMTPDDVSTYAEMGAIALPVELDMKDALDDMFTNSRWNNMEKMFPVDSASVGAMVAHVYADGNRLKVEYVDPARYFREPSEYTDGRGSTFKAFVKTRRIGEVRKYFDNTPEGDEKLRQISTMYVNNYNNRAVNGNKLSYDRSQRPATTMYNDCAFDELTLYFVDEQVKWYAHGRKEDGRFAYWNVPQDFKPKPGREVTEARTQYLFKCKWAIGTGVVYDFGIADVIARDDNGPVFPIIDRISNEPSLVERCIGFEDDKQTALFKRRAAIARLAPGPRMWIDMANLEQILDMGGDSMTMKESLENYITTGVGIYKTKSAYDLPGVERNGVKGPPITFMQAGIMEDITILTTEIQQAEESIRQATGMNPLEDGIGQADMLKHTAESMTSGMNAALAPHIEEYVDFFREICYVACQKYRLLVLKGDIVVGNEKKTKLTKDLFYRKWNVKVSIENARSKEILLADLAQNKGIIPDEAYYEIYNAIMQGDLKKSQILLTKASARSKDMEHQRMLEVQKAQADGNREAGVAVEKEKANTLNVELNNAKELEAFKFELTEKGKQEDHKRAKEMAKLNHDLDYNKDVTIASIQKPVQ